MRINAADTSLSRYIYRPDPFAAQNNPNSYPLSSQFGDSLNLSDIGERIRMQGEAITAWNTKLTNGDDDKHMQLMDKSMSEVGSVLEQMKSLTILAEDESLTDEDRMRLQIDMAKLQERLKVETKRMSLVLAGKSDDQINELLGNTDPSAGLPGVTELADDTIPDMLERALARIEEGGAWDIREKWELQTELKEVIVTTADGERRTYQPDESGGFTLPEEYDPKTTVVAYINEVTGGAWVPTDDKKSKTVSERLEEGNAIILMDSKSAKAGTERLDLEIEKLTEMREAFVDLRDEMREQAQQSKGGAKKMDEGQVDAMIGRIQQERLARQQGAVNEQLSAAEGGEPTAGGEDEIATPLGVMKYHDERGQSLDPSDPRLVEPEGPMGDFFAKLERLFKERIGNLLCVPQGGFL